MMMLMMLLVMVMGNLISKEGDVCEEVKKSVDCIVLRTGRRHIPDQTLILMVAMGLAMMVRMLTKILVVGIGHHNYCC